MHQTSIKPTIIVVIDIVASSFIILAAALTYHQCKHPRLVIPAGILRIPVFFVPVEFFSQESRFLFRCNLDRNIIRKPVCIVPT